ncbi:hypothetical protein DERP_013804, partial [Dermatophagoides pteronyssinus]
PDPSLESLVAIDDVNNAIRSSPAFTRSNSLLSSCNTASKLRSRSSNLEDNFDSVMKILNVQHHVQLLVMIVQTYRLYYNIDDVVQLDDYDYDYYYDYCPIIFVVVVVGFVLIFLSFLSIALRCLCSKRTHIKYEPFNASLVLFDVTSSNIKLPDVVLSSAENLLAFSCDIRRILDKRTFRSPSLFERFNGDCIIIIISGSSTERNKFSGNDLLVPYVTRPGDERIVVVVVVVDCSTLLLSSPERILLIFSLFEIISGDGDGCCGSIANGYAEPDPVPSELNVVPVVCNNSLQFVTDVTCDDCSLSGDIIDN